MGNQQIKNQNQEYLRYLFLLYLQQFFHFESNRCGYLKKQVVRVFSPIFRSRRIAIAAINFKNVSLKLTIFAENNRKILTHLQYFL